MHARTVSMCQWRSVFTFYKKQFFTSARIGGNSQRVASNFKPNYLAKKSSSKPFRKKFRSKTHPFAFRSSGHVTARFLFKNFVWTVRNSFAEQIFIFFAVLCVQHFALFFKRMSCLLLSGHGRGFIAVFIMSRAWRALLRLWGSRLVSVTL